MAKKETHSGKVSDLRSQAEKIARKRTVQSTENIDGQSPEETKQMLNELQVHQIELEMQNEELRRTQAELDCAVARYFDLYDLAPIGYVTVSEKGLIIEANLTAATLLGTQRSTLMKQPLSQFILKEDQNIYYLYRTQILDAHSMDSIGALRPSSVQAPQAGISQACELRMLKKDGSAFWAHLVGIAEQAEGSSVCRIVMSDITERKQTEDALRESEAMFRLLFNSGRDSIAVHILGKDSQPTNFIQVNDVACERLGYTREEMLKLLPQDIDSPEFAGQMPAIIEKLLKNKQVLFETEHISKNGNRIPVEVSTVLFQMADSQATMSVARDITARKQVEAEKAALEALNRQLQKSESLARMAGAIAHYFNNQLCVVIGNLEMAIDEQLKGAHFSKSLISAMQAAEKSAEMSNLMLTYLGQSLEKCESLDLSDVCFRSLPLLHAAMPGNVVMEKDLPLPGPIIIANTGEMQQVLTNLITNAWEALGNNKGTISLNVKKVPAANIPATQRFPRGWQPQDNAYACLEVTDEGCGIVDKDMEELFDPFFSSKFTGRGMGLPVVLGIVKAHNGVITVESNLKGGSTFSVFFPLSKEALLQPQKAVSNDDSLINAVSPIKLEEGGTVLLVEDEEMLRIMTSDMLKSLGFSVLEAKDGVEAVELFRNHQDEIKFVLSDLTMPGMNGWETLTALRELASDIPVILASGYDKAHVMAGDHPELPQAFLGKPYMLKGLSDAISEALANKKK